MADTPTREELHAALRQVALMHDLFSGNASYFCGLCFHSDHDAVWKRGQPERHAPDCLAAPDALTKGDEHE